MENVTLQTLSVPERFKSELEIALSLQLKGDKDGSILIYENLIKKKSYDAAFYLAQLYSTDKKKYDLSEKFFNIAIEGGVKVAKFYLARLLYEEKRYEKALKLFEDSAKDGLIPAKFWIYLIYKKKSHLIEKDKAINMLREAAMAGHWYAMKYFGFYLLKGGGGFLSIFIGFSYIIKTIIYAGRLLEENNPDLRC